MKVVKEVMRGEMIPPWYGVAWISMGRDSAMCLPIGLNLLAAAVRGVWVWARHGHVVISRDAREAYMEGWRAGLEEGARRSRIREEA